MKRSGIMSKNPSYKEMERQVQELSKVNAERDQVIAVLQKSEEKYRLIAEQTADAIYLVNIEREQFTYVSPSVERVFGYSPEECVGLKFQDIFTETSYALQRDEMLKAHERGQRESEVLELEAIHKHGHTLPVEVHARFLLDEQGTPREILGVARDITERKQAEEERVELQSQLLQAQKMESIGRLAGGVAHDFNNMLGVIIGRSQMALNRADQDPSLTSDLQSILKVARHSANLVRQLLTFARMQRVTPEVLDLNETLGEMLSMLQRLIGEDIELDWRPGEELWPVKIDPSQVNQILVNLCVNARDAINNVGRITIGTENIRLETATGSDQGGVGPGDYVRITFSDTGCGMSSDVLGFIFEPFFTTKGLGQGTGLGLSTVYGIVRQNKGSIEVSSEPDKGTTFRIFLPKYLGTEDPVSTEEQQPSTRRGDETILLVEDEPAMLEMTALMLDEMGYTVLSANRPEEAIRIAEKHSSRIRLLITDVVMPGMNGKELATELQSRMPDLPCLFMSGHATDKISRHVIIRPGTNFIHKPFTLNALMQKVRSVLDNGANSNG